MKNTMTFQGYAARVEYSAEDECFVGHIAGIQDRIGFHGDSVNALKNAFQEAVTDYLETCQKIGKRPQKPYSGKLLLRLSPEVHAAIANAAELSGLSINQWAASALDRETRS
jgi:predicted HicB family RNase H-like nuclease